MFYCVEMNVNVPFDLERHKFEELKAAEKTMSQNLQRNGKWVGIWRIVGRYANISIFDVADHDELHNLLSNLPLFAYMTLKVTPLARHPSAI